MKFFQPVKQISRKYVIIILTVSIVFFCLLFYIIRGLNSPLIVTEYTYTSSKIPHSFDGFRITHLSDFHCKDFGEKEEELIQAVRDTNPDMIVFTGDSIDDEHTIDNYAYLLEGIHDIAPIYYVNGNHEYDDGAPLEEAKALHRKYGVVDMNDRSILLVRDFGCIILTGLDFRNTMMKLRNDITYSKYSHFNILLYHGTDKFDGIAPYNYDLVLTGHTHGGLIKLPFIGGVITNQGELFPKYDSGNFTVGYSTMISSSGLGDAAIPRFNNPREVVSITLHSTASESE